MKKKIVYSGLVASAAIVISSLERFIPLYMFIPVPGLKLGLANCTILFALKKIDFRSAFFVMFIKSLLVSLLFSGLTSFLYSFVGGTFSIIVMYFMLKQDRCFSIVGVSVAGAAMFNIGQMVVASLLLGSVYIFSYLSILLISSIFTGVVTGYISFITIKNIKNRW